MNIEYIHCQIPSITNMAPTTFSTDRYFKVKVVTGGSYGSGTDCFIFMKLHGTQRISSEFELDLDEDGSSDLFEKDS